MKNIISIVLLMFLFVRAHLKKPPTFPDLQDSITSIQRSKEVFSVACGHTWEILNALRPIKQPFPIQFFSFFDNPGFKIHVECSTDHQTMNMTFRSTQCEPKYKDFAENPIVFRIDKIGTNSSQVSIQRISVCKSIPSLIEIAHIGYVDETIWFLVYYVLLDEKTNDLEFGMIVFERTFVSVRSIKRLEHTIKEVSSSFFNSSLDNFITPIHFYTKRNCSLNLCYDPVDNIQKDEDGKKLLKERQLQVFLLIPLLMGVILLGMIIYCSRKTSNFD